MSLVNSVRLIGHLGEDPEVKHCDNGTAVVNLSFATNEQGKDKNGQKITITEWHHIVFWDKYADIIGKFTTKGTELAIEGKLKTRSYERNEVKRYVTEVHVESFKFLSGPRKPADNSPVVPPSFDEKPPEFADDLPF